MSAVLANRFYYLENFQQVLGWIAQRYDDLLADDERRFLTRFPSLPLASRALLVRMIMRKGMLFRTTKLRYAEIGCPHAAAQPLLGQGWLACDPPLAIETLFALLKKSELAQAFAVAPADIAKPKSVLLQGLLPRYGESRPLKAWHPDIEDTIYAVCIAPMCERLRLMFFGNLHQDWSEFVLADLGIYRYEQVVFSPASRGFATRQDVDDYLHLHRCRQRHEDGECPDDIVADMPATPYGNAWIEARRGKLLFLLAQQYERRDDAKRALAIYRCCNYPGARLRAIRVLERCADIDAALALARVAWDAPESEAEQQVVQRMLARLHRKAGQRAPAAIQRFTPERMDLRLHCPGMQRVECVVQSHFSRDDAPVHYVENVLINALFGLLCWPAIFAPLPGAFFHPFHHGPADLKSPDFFRRRAALFEACLAQLDDGRYRDTVLERFAAKAGIQSPFVLWHAIDEPLLRLALDCVPPSHLRKCFERMLRDVPANCAGFPDLIQFWPREKRYRMIEVKGPGDRLQDNQLRWLRFFSTHGMPVSVCYVQWEAAA